MLMLVWETSLKQPMRPKDDEKITRTLKDYETLGKILSDKLTSEFGHENGVTIDYKRASHDEYIRRKSDYFPENRRKEDRD